MGFLRRLGTFYARIGKTYFRWSPVLMLLAVVVFLPLGLVDALSTELDVDALDLDSGIKIAALVAATGALTATSLLGEVFYSGAIAISLTHPAEERPPSLLQIARRIDYGRLIAVDLVYVLIVVAGMILFLVPGVLAFVFLGLAGPVVEIEKRSIGGALKRSYELVRGHFWLVFWIFVPIEIGGDAIGESLGHLVHDALGHSFFATWMAESVSNIVLSPVFAIAAVLLTLDLIARRDGSAPELNPKPAPAVS